MSFSLFMEHFRAALRIKTDWPPGASKGNAEAEAPLLQFQDFLTTVYPVFHKIAERHVFSPYGVAYRWPGSVPGLEPVLLLGHYDVVPVEREKWSVDPFGAELLDGRGMEDGQRDAPSGDTYIYSRGALDMKSITMAILESAEVLCSKGFQPKRDVWIALGGDEERAGIFGARETAEWFAEKNIRFSFILDEGTPVALDQIRGIDKPLAMIGIEEKGFLSVALKVEQKPGHASQPPDIQAAAILARALCRLAVRPFPWKLNTVIEAFFRNLSYHTGGPLRFVMAHARLLGPLFFKAAAVSPAIKALLRTTVAMTQLEGSAADNVMPSEVKAVINLRLLSPWTVEKAVERLQSVIADERVKVSIHNLATDPVPAAPGQAVMEGPGWNELRQTIEQVFPGTPALPFLMLATTDSRHYQKLSAQIFRFSPQKLNPGELSRIHGHDERISLENLKNCLAFYSRLLECL
jgi:carboxypeptidase PM20D1